MISMKASQRKKVVYLFGSLRVGGTERQVIETAIGLNREYFEPKLYCLSGGGPLLSRVEQHGLDVTFGHVAPLQAQRRRVFPMTWLKKFLKLSRYLRRERPDIVHAYLLTPSVYGGLATRLMGRPPVLISSRRCLGLFKDELQAHYQVMENLVNCWTDAIVVNSQAVRQAVLQRERVNAKTIHVIYNGVDTRTYRPDADDSNSRRARQRQVLGIADEEIVFGMVANLIPYKGYHDFLRAAAIVTQQHPQTRFLCIGEDRGLRGQLEQLALELSIRHQVLFTGRIDAMPDMLPALDIQVSASHQEGFSNAILEGMACGKPMIATAVGGTPEVVEDKVTGRLVPPHNPPALAEAMHALVCQPGQALEMGLRARQRVEEHFSLEKMVDKLENLYVTLAP